jgi:hypothetical protein
MPDFGIMRGFNEKLFGDKLVAGQLPTQLGLIGSQDIESLLLDFYPNASAAYSVRKLRLAYTGSAIRVRRSSDNTETDIGFNGANLDTTALTSFCSGTNGFVTTWYDQSGNGINATQTTAANQPQIVSSGSVINTNSKPSLQFDGVNDFFDHTLNVNSGFSLISAVVQNMNNLAGIDGVYNFTAPNNRLMNNMMSNANNANWGLYINSFKNSGFNIYNVQSFIASYSDNLFSGTVTNYLITNNNTTTVTDNGRYAGDVTKRQYIGLDVSIAQAYFGTMQEIVVYNSDQYSNLTGFRNNINTYYAIY